MIRDYTNKASTDAVKFFTGIEVEKTKFHGLLTLFVVDTPEVKSIVQYAKDYKIGHIYLGANQSWKTYEAHDYMLVKPTIDSLLEANLNVTVDVPHNAPIQCLEPLFSNPRFQINFAVAIPYVDKLKDCAIIKIDDEDFNKTNTGVWCLPLSQIMTDTNYTGWKEYTKDTAIDDDREKNI